MSMTLDLVRANALRTLIPPPKVDLPTWIESNVYLPESVSALPGPIRLTTVQRGIAEAIGDSSIERVTLVKPVRLGLSTLLTATMGSFIANEPSPILALLPTESDCRDFVVSDVEPIFEGSPSLRGLLTGENDEAGRNTLLSRRFPGGSLKVVASKAPRNLRRHNVRILLIDEADAMEVTSEGSPIVLAERRTLSFNNRKIVLGSTPTYEETSHVLRSYRESDQRIFEICCPHCSTWFELLWRHIQWPEGQPERAHAVCEECGGIIEESEKAALVDAGRWRATAPHVTDHAGFRVNALVSNLHNARWSVIAKEFLVARKSPDQLQVFRNTLLAEGWRTAVEEVNEVELATRAQDFGLDNIPAAVVIVTVGIDVQHDRLEATILGHARDNQVYVLSHQVIWGSPHDDSTWAECDELLRSTWKHPNDGTLRVDACAIDSGDGATTDAVLAFCRPRLSRKVVAIKGVQGQRPAIEVSKSKGSKLFIVGVDGLKQNLVSRLSHNQGLHFSKDLPLRFYEEIASERVIVRYVRGVPSRLWERKPGMRAECLDVSG